MWLRWWFTVIFLLSACLSGGGGSGGGGKTSVAKVVLTVVNDYQPANGDTLITVLAAVRDHNNAPLANIPVEVSTTSATAFFVPRNKETDERGLVVVDFFDTAMETFKVTMNAQGVQSLPISLTFITPTGAIELTATEQVLPVGGTAHLTVITSQPKSSEGSSKDFQPLANAPLEIKISGAAILDGQLPSFTNAHGQATFMVTDKIAETVTVKVKSGAITQTLSLFFGATLSLLPSSTNAIGETFLTAVLKDSNNTALAEQPIHFNFIGNNREILSPTSAVTDKDGTATVKVTDLEKNGGSVVVSASSGAFKARATVNFLAAFGQNRQLDVKMTTQVLKIGQSTTITAHITDKIGLPIMGQGVNFSVQGIGDSPTQARLSLTQGISNEQGEVSSVISNTVGENVRVVVQADAARQEIPFYFGAKLTLTPSTASGIADRTTPVKLTASLNDALGSGIVGIPVNFRKIQGFGLLDSFQEKTNELGQANLGVTDSLPEMVVIQAEVGQLESATAELTFLAPGASLELKVASRAVPVGETVEVSVITEQEINGIKGAPLPYAPLLVSVSGSAQLGKLPFGTDAMGKAVFTVTNRQLENVLVTVTSGSIVQRLPLYFGATLSLLPLTSAAVEKAVLTALLKDGQDTPIAGETIAFSFVGSNHKTLNPTTVVTSSDGTAVVTVTDLAKEFGETMVRASSGLLSAQATVTFKENLLDDQVASVRLMVANDFQAADGKSAINLTVMVFDAQGAPLPNVQVNLLSSSSTAFFEALSGTTEADGRFTTKVTNQVAEVVQVTPSAGKWPGQPVTITFVSSNLDRRVASVKLTVTDNSQLADGRSPITVSVIVRDANNLSVPNVQVHLISKSDTALFQDIEGTTGDDGHFTTTVVSSVAETFEVTALAGGVNSETVNVIFTAAVGAIFLTASEVLVATGNSSKITLALLRKTEQEGNLDTLLQKGLLLPRTAFKVSISGQALLNGVPAMTDDNGQAVFTVSDDSAEDVTITVTSGPVAQTLKLYFGASLVLLPPTSNAVNSTQLKVLLSNGKKTPLAGQVINFSFEQVSNETLSPSQVVTNLDGTAEVSIVDLENDGGNVVVKAVSGQLTAKATVNFLAKVGEGLHFEVKSSATLLRIGQVVTVMARLKDKVEVPVVGQPVNFSIAAAGGGESQAKILETTPTNSLTDEKGEVRIVLTDNVGENLVVTGQIGTTLQKLPLYFGASVTLTPFEVNGNANGATHTVLTASVKDAFRSGIPDVMVNFQAPKGSALLDPFQVYTDELGLAVVRVTNTAVEATEVKAQADNLMASATINFIGSGSPFTITMVTAPPEPLELSLNATATITAIVKDDRGFPVKDGIRIDFTNSNQIGSVTESAFTRGGEASVNFNAGTKAGLTTVEATSSVRYGNEDENSFYANAGVAITVKPGEVGILEVYKVEPKVIGIVGSGVNQSTTIQFLVKDNLGNPVKDETEVKFSLGETTLGGGESISTGDGGKMTSVTGKTNRGIASVTLKSGTVAGNIDVIAQVGEISTVARVTIVGNVPEIEHFSLAMDYLNISGGLRFGLFDEVTAYVGDRFGNIVPDGTTVSFITEGGTIGKSVQGEAFTTTTEFGQATAVLQSAAPTTPALGGLPTFRYEGYECSGDYHPVVAPFPRELCGNPGWVTIIAYTTGSEGFVDVNGNGRYDEGIDRLSEPGFVDANQNQRWEEGEMITGKGDMSEPFIDGNDDQIFNPGELYIDVNSNGKFDGPDGKFQANTVIWRSSHVLFSTDTAPLVVTPGEFKILNSDSQTFTVYGVSDIYGNTLVAGTRFLVTTNNGILGGTTDLTFTDGISPLSSPIQFTLASKEPVQTLEKDAEGKAFISLEYPLPTSATITVEIRSPLLVSAPGGNGDKRVVIQGKINMLPEETKK